MPMPVWIRAFSVDAKVLFIRKFRSKKTMCCVKCFSSCDEYFCHEILFFGMQRPFELLVAWFVSLEERFVCVIVYWLVAFVEPAGRLGSGLFILMLRI